ncbi:MAG: hypothetical protein IJK39_04670 [Bacteroidales bacterium]|jgi:hypothetical protein|nr:hypothetical protein [Bacteroidales bacterium]MBR6972194.1 hypothetical protein [Bacteroidales bacterium]
MNGFVELSVSEQTMVFGGKDADVSRFMEALGYGIGALVRAIKLFIQNRRNVQNIPMEILKMYAK